MAETVNYKLYKSSDDKTKFRDWREKIAGETDSNMDKIDSALKAHDLALAAKQDTLTGTAGQVVGFDAEGKAVAQEAPDTGVTSFKGRKGAVVPQDGDYTPRMVGAVPTTRKVNGKQMNADISLSASDVGAMTQTAADGRYLKLTGGTVTGPVTIGKMKMTWNASAGCLEFEVV